MPHCFCFIFRSFFSCVVSNGSLWLQSHLRAWTIMACLFILRHKDIKIDFKFTSCPVSVQDPLSSSDNSFRFWTSFIEYFFPNEISCSSYHCASCSIFQILLKNLPLCRARFPVLQRLPCGRQCRSWSWLTSILNVRGALPLPFRFHLPFLTLP